METYKKIYFEMSGGERTIHFGKPTDKRELEEMFELRYEVYVKHGYVEKEMFQNGKEIDKYDLKGCCDYFVAEVNKKIIGSARVIRDNYLPTEKECFQFDEPEEMKKIPRGRRLELSRLVAKSYKINNEFLPRHLVLLGLISLVLDFALEKNIEGGYAFIKSSLGKKLRKLGIPFHRIEPYRQIYKQEFLWRYFHQENDPVFPIFFLRDEVKDRLDRMLNNKLIFKKLNEREYKFKKINLFKLILYKILQ